MRLTTRRPSQVRISLTFFTLWGFFSLRHLRMSISVVLTQPGCGVGEGGGKGAQILSPDGLYSRLILLTSAQHCFCTHHRPMDVPECPLLAVQDLPLRLVLLPVNPARKEPQRTCLAKIRDGTIRQTKRAEQPWSLSARLSSRGLD